MFKDGEPPLISLFLMMKSLDLPEAMRSRTWIEPPLVIRAADDSVHPEYAAITLSVGFSP